MSQRGTATRPPARPVLLQRRRHDLPVRPQLGAGELEREAVAAHDLKRGGRVLLTEILLPRIARQGTVCQI